MNDGAQVKGYTFLSYVTPIQRDRGALWAKLEQQLNEECRQFLTGAIYANSWYPRRYLHELMRAFCSATGHSSQDLRELGALAARYQVHLIYRMFLKFATPALVFNRAASVWSRQSTQGTFMVVEEGDDFLIGQLDDPDLPEGIPDVMAGWSDTIIAMLGRTPYPTTWEKVGLRRWRFKVSWLKR